MQIPGLSAALPAILSAQERGKGVVIATVIASSRPDIARPAQRLVVMEDESPVGSIHPSLDAVLLTGALESLTNRSSQTRSYSWTDAGPEPARSARGEIDVYFEVLARPARLVIVGAGHIAVPLARMAKLLDFQVVVLDDRPEYANQERFPEADQILVGPYRETLRGVDLDSDSHIVLVTRGHVHDQACLEEVLNGPAAYIGMIGSRRRVRTVMAHVHANGHDLENLKRVYAPVGLDIGARTPAEIALAIMAEIVNVRRGGRAPSLALGERLYV